MVSNKKALEIMELLLQGKAPKEVAYIFKVHISVITQVKQMFPLFLGLVQKRKNNA